MLLRVLVYDRGLAARAGGEVRVAVLYRPGDAASERERDGLLAAFDEVGRQAVAAGLPVRAVAVPVHGAADVALRLAARHPVALYACAGLGEAAAELARIARVQKVLAFGGSRDLVERGFAAALVDRGDRAGLVVSPRAAADQGADLDSALLAVAEIAGAGSGGGSPR